MFTPRELGLERGWPGRIDGDRIVQLAAQTLQAFFTGGGGAREHAEFSRAECELRAPVRHPPSVRVFAPFEEGEPPHFVFVSPYPILGPEEELVYPGGTGDLSYGPAVAVMIGSYGAIGGFTLANLWTARDVASEERAAGFGPSKSCDFGLSLGPVVVTPDEFEGRRVAARVNGEERSRVELAGLASSWSRLVDHAAVNTALRPGDLLLARAAADDAPSLGPGDVVELELEGVGVLRNSVGAHVGEREPAVNPGS